MYYKDWTSWSPRIPFINPKPVSVSVERTLLVLHRCGNLLFVFPAKFLVFKYENYDFISCIKRKILITIAWDVPYKSWTAGIKHILSCRNNMLLYLWKGFSIFFFLNWYFTELLFRVLHARGNDPLDNLPLALQKLPIYARNKLICKYLKKLLFFYCS